MEFADLVLFCAEDGGEVVCHDGLEGVMVRVTLRIQSTFNVGEEEHNSVTAEHLSKQTTSARFG